MANHSLRYEGLTEKALGQLAQRLATRLHPGDFLALYGDLGAGKTSFARALIRALMANEQEEVPSPTFAIVQPYDAPRFPVQHFDFYRLSGPEEAEELGLDEALSSGLVIAEWPERLENDLPQDRLDIYLGERGAPDLRQVSFEAHGSWQGRLARFAEIEAFLQQADWRDARPYFLNGDASTRSYARLVSGAKSALLMDSPKMSDGPPIRDGRPYSQIAHLAEDVRPFVAVASALRHAGLAAPQILAQDLATGFLLIEDFGDLTFTHLHNEGQDLAPFYRLAVDGLLQLRQTPPPPVLQAGDIAYQMPDFDAEALHIETELLTDWFLPALRREAVSEDEKQAFHNIWNDQFGWLLDQPTGWVLRDYHSPNLILRPQEDGVRRLGVIDFQDAMRGSPAYDLVSLLQDARLDLPAGLEDELLGYYCDNAEKAEPDFSRADFIRAYRLLGAQRATKILGIFARLARRDGKHAYLRHIPRIARYLTGNLSDPNLAQLKAWYASHAFTNHDDIALKI